jgi:hypothetical protein
MHCTQGDYTTAFCLWIFITDFPSRELEEVVNALDEIQEVNLLDIRMYKCSHFRKERKAEMHNSHKRRDEFNKRAEDVTVSRACFYRPTFSCATSIGTRSIYHIHKAITQPQQHSEKGAYRRTS